MRRRSRPAHRTHSAAARVVSPVASKADLKAFIDLPKRLFAGHKGYTPHLNVERQEAFSPKKNPLLKHVQVQFFLARRGGRVRRGSQGQVQDHVRSGRNAGNAGRARDTPGTVGVWELRKPTLA